MQLTSSYNPLTAEHVWILRLTTVDMIQLRLDDLALFRECGESDSAADKLLALEAIVRKIEQSQK